MSSRICCSATDRTNPSSPRAGIQKSQRTESAALISEVVRGRIKDGLVVSIEWDAGELRSNDAATLPSDHLLELRVKREPLAIGELTQRISGRG